MFSKEGIRKDTFSAKILRIRRRNSGRSLPVKNFVEYHSGLTSSKIGYKPTFPQMIDLSPKGSDRLKGGDS